MNDQEKLKFYQYLLKQIAHYQVCPNQNPLEVIQELQEIAKDGLNEKVQCCDCQFYISNDDTGNECQGAEKPCHEFILTRLPY